MQRVDSVDVLRGLALIGMVLCHYPIFLSNGAGADGMAYFLANHLLGFGLLGALLILKGAPWERLAGLDPWLLLGGVLGALFVAISSWAIGRIGALACALLIVTGQLAGGALLDALAGRLAASDLLGILLVLAGAALQRWQGGKSRSRG